MPKEKVKRTMNYVMSARIRGEIAQQHISIDKACEYAGVSKFTLYKLFEDPTEYFPNTLRLMRNLTIPIEDVREMIQYPW